jgi:hypothetical protein
MRESFDNSQAKSSVELQDLGHGQWRAVCGDRSFETTVRDGDLWVDHRSLTAFFGYVGRQGPQKLEWLLDTCLKDGLVSPSEVVTETVTNKNGELWKVISVQRKAALCLAMRCTLPNAIALARQMADVFELWLDRRHAPVPIPVTRVDVLGLIGEYGEYSGSRIKAELRKLADLYSGGAMHSSREWKRSRGRLDSRLRRAVALGWGRRWSVLPKACWDIVMLNLGDMHQEACRDRKRLGAPVAKQTDFVFN